MPAELSERCADIGSITYRLPLDSESYVRPLNEQVNSAGRFADGPK